MRRPTANQKAFTLIEVIMAATVLAVGFTAVIQAVIMGADMIDTARKQQIAQQIIDGEIAYQRQRSWLAISFMPDGGSSVQIRVLDDGTSAVKDSSSGYTDTNYFILDDNVPLMAVAKGFTCNAAATRIRPTTGPVTFLSIMWTVTWTGHLGKLHTRTGVAFFGQNGLHLSYEK